MATKPRASVNPKNLAARERIKPALLPAAGIIHGATAAMLGATKYGPYNWREQEIALMEYISAIMRHCMKWVDGEDYEENIVDGKKILVHHLGSVIAGASIALDAIEFGNAIDDRPRRGPAATLLRRLTAEPAAVKK